MTWLKKEYAELTGKEIHELFKERIAVFVVEQNCPYQEIDDDDLQATHIYLMDEDNKLKSYSRIIDKGDYVTFGRVLVSQKNRKDGLGRQLIEQTLATIEEKYPQKTVQISAQTYLLDFYSSFGFEKIAESYLEDGIPHQDMVLKK